jgi:hypothetical protein
MSDAPSAYKIEQALSVWQGARARLLMEDESLEHDQQALEEILGQETEEVEEALARTVRAAVFAKSQAEAASKMIDDLQARRQRYLNRDQSLRGTALAIMSAMEWKKREAPDFTVSIRAPHQSVKITDEAAVPDEYVKVTRTPDKTALMADLKVGVVIPGAELAEGLPSISVRTR